MRTYLNKQEKNFMIYSLTFGEHMESDINQKIKSSSFFDQQEKEEFQKAVNLLQSFNKKIIKRIDTLSFKTMHNTINNNEIDIIPKKEYVKYVKEVQEDQDLLHTLVEASLFKCYLACNGNRDICELKDVFNKYEVTYLDIEEQDGCQYRCDIRKHDKYSLNNGDLNFNDTELKMLISACKSMANKNYTLEIEDETYGADMLYTIADRIKIYLKKRNENG